MTYRPTVRYDERFRSYVDDLYHATTLDRNQIMRLALFLLGYTKEGEETLKQFLKKDRTSLPSPNWRRNHMEVWKEKTIREPLEGETSDGDVQEIKPVIIDMRGEGRLVQGNDMEGSKRESSQPPREIRKIGKGVKIVIGGGADPLRAGRGEETNL